MTELLLVLLAGFAASMVDGVLGMGFGPTSSSILLGSGLSPAGVSATVNIAKIATGAAAAISHWRFGNIDRRLVVRLAVPGALGALVGVAILGSVDGDQLKPVLALLLGLLGLRILVRFARPIDRDTPESDAPAEGPGVVLAGAAGGVTNGLVGAWGPVVTPALLHRGVRPRYAIGSVNTAEVAVAVVAVGSLFSSLGGSGVEVATVVAMLVGGVIAAPLAAWAVRHIPARGMGVAVGGMLLLTNGRELASWGGLGQIRWVGYLAIVVLVLVVAVAPRLVTQRRAITPAVDEA